MRFISLLVLLFLGHPMCAQAPFSFTVVNLSGTGSLTCNKTSLDFSVTVSGDTSSLGCVWQGPFAIQGFSASLVTVGIYTVSVSSGTTIVQQTVSVSDGRTYPLISATNGPFTISCPSGTVELVASVAGNDPVDFSWYHNTQTPVIGNGSVFIAAAAGQYAVVAVNQINGCAARFVFDVWACTNMGEPRAIKSCKIFPNPVKDRFGCNLKFRRAQ